MDNKDHELLLTKIEQLNENLSEFKTDIKDDIKELKESITKLNTMEIKVNQLDEWKERVVDVLSASQMKELKDEVYKQKNRWNVTLGVLAVAQFILTVVLTQFPFFKK